MPNLLDVTADQHHVGFIGLKTDDGTTVVPAVDDYIQIVEGTAISTLSLIHI